MHFNSLKWVALFLLFGLVIWAEFALFYVSLLQCTWPQISENKNDKFIYTGADSKPVKILVISDTHIGSRHQWIDKTRRHWLLKRAFRTAMSLYHPDLVLHLGDLLDQGSFEPDEDFKADAQIVKDIFSVDERITFKVVPGNHDIGYHQWLHRHTYMRFNRAFRPHIVGDFVGGVRLWAYQRLLFVIVDSMALESDGCRFCQHADEELQLVNKRLQCLRGELALQSCQGDFESIMEPGSDILQPGEYSHPILIQHFPFYRPNETVCEAGLRDSMPDPQRREAYRPGIDCLFDAATKQLLFSIRPRLALAGHTHYYCRRNHTMGTRTGDTWWTEEWTLPPLSYRVSNSPGFVLAEGKGTSNSDDLSNEEEVRVIGPQLAPDAAVPSGGIGPSLPEHLVRERMAAEAEGVERDGTEPIDIATIGPLLPGNEVVEELRHFSARPEDDLVSNVVPPPAECMEREAWMTDYLPVSKDPKAALKPRKFQQGVSTASAVDATWFTVGGSQPSSSSSAFSKAATANIPKSDPHSLTMRDAIAARDNKMMVVATEYNKRHHRNESLLEKHQRKRAREVRKSRETRKHKRRENSTSSTSSASSSCSTSGTSSCSEEQSNPKSHRKHKHSHYEKAKKVKKRKRGKKKGKKSEKPTPTRQPFDRERDLFVSRVDTLQRRAIIERSKQLGSKFAHGGQKFL